MIAWRLSESVYYRGCGASTEALVFESLSGSAHVLAELGSLMVERCARTAQTLDNLIDIANEYFEADQAEELNAAVSDTVRQLHSLGILTPCSINSGNSTLTQSSNG